MRFQDTDLAWAAGFIEGEGCFLINQSRVTNFHVFLKVAQVDKVPLVKLHSLFGGSLLQYKQRENRSAAWLWAVGIGFMRDTMPLLIPYMTGNKRKQAEFASKFAISMKTQGKVRVTEDELKRRVKAKEALSSMKSRNAL